MKNRRKVILINKDFQLKFLAKIIFLVLLNNLIFISSVSYFFKDLESTAKGIGLPTKHIFFTFINQQYYDLLMIVFVVSLVSSLIIFAVGLMISHKIAGPLYRLRSDLDNMAQEGAISKVNFRDKDYFVELEKSFNNFAEKLNKG